MNYHEAVNGAPQGVKRINRAAVRERQMRIFVQNTHSLALPKVIPAMPGALGSAGKASHACPEMSPGAQHTDRNISRKPLLSLEDQE